MGRSWGTGIALTLLALGAAVADWISDAVRGLWPSVLMVVLGWFFMQRTEQEMEPTFSGPELHRPWLQATAWFFIAAGLLGMLMSLLPLLNG
jgi:hypothetical protein